MSALKFVLLFVTLMASGYCQSPSSLDAFLYSSFCERPLTKQAFGVCYKVAADNDVNLFGTDMYSVAETGEVKSHSLTSVKQAAFTVVASGEKVKITCTTSFVEFVPMDALLIIPATFDDSVVRLAEGPVMAANVVTGYSVTATVKKGATLLYHSNIPTKCTWTAAV